MLNNSIYRELVSIVEKENVLQNEPMSNHTSFKIGGNAIRAIIASITMAPNISVKVNPFFIKTSYLQLSPSANKV